MDMTNQRRYAALNLTPAALLDLRKAVLTAQAAVGRRVPTSDVVTALTVLAERHADELSSLLTANDTKDTDASGPAS